MFQISEEPQLPPIPSISEEYFRKDRVIERKYTVLKCHSCQAKYSRTVNTGDFTFKKIANEECEKCKRRALTIEEIYSEFYDTKKNKVIL